MVFVGLTGRYSREALSLVLLEMRQYRGSRRTCDFV